LDVLVALEKVGALGLAVRRVEGRYFVRGLLVVGREVVMGPELKLELE
jgi:hypothetical protein